MYKLSKGFWITLDSQGFPFIRRAKWNFFISLFPMTEAQMGLSSEAPVNSHSPWKNFARSFSQQKIETFLVSLNGKQKKSSQEDHKDDLIYMIEQGSKYRLPTEKQWLDLLECHETIQDLGKELRAFCRNHSVSETTKNLIEEKLFPLVNEGLFESIRGDNEEEDQYLGRPWQKLMPNLMRPNTLRKVRKKEATAEAAELTSFRLVREAPSLHLRLEKFLLFCRSLEKSQGELSKVAVYGTPDESLVTPRFRYLSPQVEHKKSFDHESDLFFLGILFMETMCGFPCDYTRASWKNSEFAEQSNPLIEAMISPPYSIKTAELIATVEQLISLSEVSV